MSKHKREAGFGVIELALVIAVIASLMAIGWVAHAKVANRADLAAGTSAARSGDPYAGWKAYTSSFEKLSFRYPGDWAPAAADDNFGIAGADSLQLKSPSGAMTVSWFSAVQGIGGTCDAAVMPGGGEAGPEDLRACPYWYVLDKQKLAGADLYYVAGVQTDDGRAYSPWCALQSSEGILHSEGNIGHLLFRGKHNDFVEGGHDYGPQGAGLMCGKVSGSLGGVVAMTGTKAQATAFLSTPEFRQAKRILLSAKY